MNSLITILFVRYYEYTWVFFGMQYFFMLQKELCEVY